jgi:hypothetical protein
LEAAKASLSLPEECFVAVSETNELETGEASMSRELHRALPVNQTRHATPTLNFNTPSHRLIDNGTPSMHSHSHTLTLSHSPTCTLTHNSKVEAMTLHHKSTGVVNTLKYTESSAILFPSSRIHRLHLSASVSPVRQHACLFPLKYADDV